MTVPFRLPKYRVITAPITCGSFSDQVDAIAALAHARISSYVCCVNAHMTMEARDSGFAKVVSGADLATPDGMPVLLAMRGLHGVDQERVAGNDLMPALLEKAESEGLSVYLYGGSEEVHRRILERVAREHPRLVIAGCHAPPYGPLSQFDLRVESNRINSTGAQIIMVSLGCPKQERFMAALKGLVNGVMLGLGGAFLLYAGIDSRAPKWMRSLSLEWLYRLWLEPRRLWKRYLVTNVLFLAYLAREIVRRMTRPRAYGHPME